MLKFAKMSQKLRKVSFFDEKRLNFVVQINIKNLTFIVVAD
jgi:hypothetical protein